MALRKTTEDTEILNHPPIEGRGVGRAAPGRPKADLILIDDENGNRQNPVDAPNAPAHTATDRAASVPQTSTVTDGESG